MNTLISLQNQAINAAKNGDWQTAADTNLKIIELDDQNIGGLNRLAVCQAQLGQLKAAKTSYEKVLAIDPGNSIALKQLAQLKSKSTLKTPQFSRQQFVEEPSKSKIVALHRLAGKNILENLFVGQDLLLKPKNRYISVETEDKVYLGSLPEDLSLRLGKLINTNNKYSCQVHSFSHNSCYVYLLETYQSPENEHRLSFVSGKSGAESGLDLDDEFFLDSGIPIDIIETDNESEGGRAGEETNLAEIAEREEEN